MDESILTSIKKLVSIPEESEDFDMDIVLHINTVFSFLNQLGAGPENGFYIFDETTLWSEYTDNLKLLGFVKQYMYIKVRLVFDPPTVSTVLAAYVRTAAELEERIKIEAETTDYITTYNNDNTYSTDDSYQSILSSIKKLIGVSEDDTDFDMDLIIYINAAFSTLYQVGAGPLTGFFISDEETSWSEFTRNTILIGFVKQYVYIKVRMIFDPPTSGSVLDIYKKMSDELEERIKIQAESTVVPSGGIVPSGTYKITENGIYDIMTYAEVDVNVPIPNGYIIPSGTLNITTNGEHYITNYEKVNVDVPIPDGYIIPSGTLNITINGEHNITNYEKVNVDVPIPDGYIVPTGSITINENGDYNIVDYANVSVNVKGIDTSSATAKPSHMLAGFTAFANDEKIEGTIKTYDYSTNEYISGHIDEYFEGKVTEIYNDRVTSIADNTFRAITHITKVDLPNAKIIGKLAFHSCSELTSVNLPKVEQLGSQCLNSVPLTSIYLPSAKTLDVYIFGGCGALEEAIFDNVTALNDMTFYQCPRLKKVVIRTKGVVATIGSRSFYQCYRILGEVHATYNPDGLADGFIYVDDELVEQYKVATNWATWASQIRPLSELGEE